MTDTKSTKDIESSIQLMEKIFIKDESEAKNDRNNNNTCEEAKEQKNNLSKMFFKPWEESSLKKFDTT